MVRESHYLIITQNAKPEKFFDFGTSQRRVNEIRRENDRKTPCYKWVRESRSCSCQPFSVQILNGIYGDPVL